MTTEEEAPKRRRTDTQLPSTPEELFVTFVNKADEVKEASHRLANRLAAATLSLEVLERTRKNSRNRRWAIAAVTFLFTSWFALWAMDQHIEECAVLGRPGPTDTAQILFWDISTETVCDATFPLHDHARKHRILEDEFLREDVEQVIKDWISDNPEEVIQIWREANEEGGN